MNVPFKQETHKISAAHKVARIGVIFFGIFAVAGAFSGDWIPAGALGAVAVAFEVLGALADRYRGPKIRW